MAGRTLQTRVSIFSGATAIWIDTRQTQPHLSQKIVKVNLEVAPVCETAGAAS